MEGIPTSSLGNNNDKQAYSNQGEC